MGTIAQIATGAAVVLLVLVVLAGALFWKRPIAVLTWTSRASLTLGGLTKKKVPSSIGPQVFWEQGSGKVVVLLHGIGDNAGTWAKVAPALSKTFHVIVPDLAGRGQSAPATGPISFDAVLTGLEAVISSSVPAERVVLVGSSLGAWMAMLYTLKHPARVEHLVLVNGGGSLGINPNVTLMPSSREEARALFDAMLHRGFTSVPSCLLDDVVRRAPNSPVKRFSFDDIARNLLDTRLKEFALPVDLIWGKSDKLVPLDYAKRMMEGLSAARLTVLPNCGHIPHSEQPASFIETLRKVLAEPMVARAAGTSQ